MPADVIRHCAAELICTQTVTQTNSNRKAAPVACTLPAAALLTAMACLVAGSHAGKVLPCYIDRNGPHPALLTVHSSMCLRT